MVLAGKAGVSTRVLLTGFLQEFRIETLPFEEHHWPVALEAFTRFGKGRHAAGLNLGDCFTYATARVAGEPLLCLGDDFAQTDLEVVAL